MMISGCACNGVNCPHCNPNLWFGPKHVNPASGAIQIELSEMRQRIDALEALLKSKICKRDCACCDDIKAMLKGGSSYTGGQTLEVGR